MALPAGGFTPSMSMNLDLNQLLPTETSGSSTTTGTGKSRQDVRLVFDPKTKSFLDASIDDETYSKDAAIKDAMGLSDLTMKQLLQQNAPGIAGATKTAGGYNSTTSDMLTNDLNARVSAQGASVVADLIQRYANIKNTGIQTAAQAVNTTTGRVTDTSQETTQETTQQTSNEGQFASSIKKFVPAVGGGTVICTRLYLDGHISRAGYLADLRYVQKHFSVEVQDGYRFYAVPFVSLMRRNKLAYAIGHFFGMHWSNHCQGYHNIFAAVIEAIAVPVCYVTGCVVGPVSYDHLYKGNK